MKFFDDVFDLSNLQFDEKDIETIFWPHTIDRDEKVRREIGDNLLTVEAEALNERDDLYYYFSDLRVFYSRDDS